MNTLTVRMLGGTDAATYQALRLRSLREHPEAFGAAPEDEEQRPLDFIVNRLENGPPDSATFGAFDGDTLVGIGTLVRYTGRKLRHKANIFAMYVAPEARGRNVGRAIVAALIDHARLIGVEDVTLAVTVGNPVARRLYINAGFVPYGIEPRYIRLPDRAYDMELMIRSVDREQ